MNSTENTENSANGENSVNSVNTVNTVNTVTVNTVSTASDAGATGRAGSRGASGVPPVHASFRRVSWSALSWGAGLGALLYAPVISVLHLRLNDVGSLTVSLASWLWFMVLYAAFAGITSTVCAWIWWLVVRFVLRRRTVALGNRSVSPRHTAGVANESDWIDPLAPAVGLATTPGGLAGFTILYWVFGTLYGLTYDQTLFWHPRGWIGMSIYLALCAFLIAGICFVAVIYGVRWVRRLGGRRVVLVLVAVAALLHLGVPLLERSDAEEHTETARDEVDLIGIDGQGSAKSAASPNFPARKVILLGLDGLDPRVIDRLVQEQRLPTFARLREQGVSAPLRTLPGANSAVLWASIYTGTVPSEHGIHDFYRIRLAGLEIGFFPVHRTWFKEMAGVLSRFGLADRWPIQRQDQKRFPVWEIVDHYGVETGVIDGYLTSYPAVALDSPGSFFVAYGTDSFAAEYDNGTLPVTDLGLFVQPIDLLAPAQLPRQDDFEWQSAMALDVIARGKQPRFLNLYSHQPDALQHESWRGYEPRRYPGTAPAEDKGAIEALHQRFDQFLAAITATADPGTVFVLVSDHGHSPTLIHQLDTQHRHGPAGVVMIWGPGVRAGAELDVPSIYDVTPTVMALLGLPLPREAAGRGLNEAFGPGFEPLAERRVDRYQGRWQPPVGVAERDPVLRALEIEKLKKMGYLN